MQMRGAIAPEALQARLLARVRRQLAALPEGITEKRMLGGITFFLNGNMLCGVSHLGLMVRVGADTALFALERPFASPCPGARGRLPGFVIVGFGGLRTKKALVMWLDMARRYVCTLPAKSVKVRRKAAINEWSRPIPSQKAVR